MFLIISAGEARPSSWRMRLANTGGDAEFYPDGDTWVIKNVSIPTCLDENAALVDRLMSIPDVTVSKELKTLRDKLTSMGH
ncbi:hypothetical protein AB0P05_43070 [Streptomyces flaveolus]|uniref:hypothetical protein n=1 Tax=Streptomyces flaveolus TaxID=67297 RepID=UPI0034224230